MKLKNTLLITALTASLVLSGCSMQNQQVPATGVESDSSTSEISKEAVETENADSTTFLTTTIALLGETHEASGTYFESNEVVYSADGNYLIGRRYPVTAFGIQTVLYTSIDSNDIVNSISLHLGEDNFDIIADEMKNQLGSPSQVNDTPSEAGYTNLMWDLEGKLIYLYKGYGTVDLQLILPDNTTASVMDETFTSSLPDTIVPTLANAKPYPLLKDYIIKAFEIPEEYLSKTKYYYNYVDLNGDGQSEIFTVVMGPYTSGSGGSTALVLYEFEGEIREVTKMTLIHTPIIISDNATKGMKDIIVLRSGGGAEATYVKLTSTGEGHYTDVSSGQPLETLVGIQGRAIIVNDLLVDLEQGSYLSLD